MQNMEIKNALGCVGDHPSLHPQEYIILGDYTKKRKKVLHLPAVSLTPFPRSQAVSYRLVCHVCTASNTARQAVEH
jgi:hypothetical protein